MSSPEAIPSSSERSADSQELESIASEHREVLRNSLEKAEKEHKKSSKEALQSAHQEALDQAAPAETGAQRSERSPAEKRSTLITKRHRDQSFNKQMENIQPHLSKKEQQLSKIIHQKTVEKTSDALSNTIARPNALLAGSISAFLLVTIVYLLAKHYGYQLSGFETIGAFIFGWILGFIYDYLRLLIKGAK